MNVQSYRRALAWFVFLSSSQLVAQQPAGSEFAVSTITSALSQDAAIEVAPDGSFVVVWNSNMSTGGDTLGTSIQARRFLANGAPAGAAFQVNTYTTGSQTSPTVAIDTDGEFIILWSSVGSPGNDSDDYSLQARRFESDGDPLGAQFQVNAYTTARQDAAHAVYLPSGELLVAWQSWGSGGTDPGPSQSVQLRRFDPAGAPLAAEFQVNSYTTGDQTAPDVAADGTGAFVVVWGGSSSPEPGDTFGIVARRFDPAGDPLGNDFPVNSFTTGGQSGAEVAMRGDGSFVVAWTSEGSSGSDNDSSSIQGRAFNAAGVPLAPDFQINSYTTANQNSASLELDAAGGFVATWQSPGSGGTDNQMWSVQARSFNIPASPAGADFQVNTTISGDQRQPRLGANGSGQFVVVWEDDPPVLNLGSGPVSIRGQRFRSGLFSDGFESQNTGAWTISQP